MGVVMGRLLMIVVLTPVLLVALAFGLLYVPAVQQFAVAQAASWLSETMGYDVSVGYVRLAFPIDLSLEDVAVVQEGDTLVRVGSLKVVVEARPLLDGDVVVDHFELNDLSLNTGDLVGSVLLKGDIGQVSLGSSNVSLADETVMAGSLSLSDVGLDIWMREDTAAVDTTSEPTMWKITVPEIDIRNTDVCLHLTGDTMQMAVGLAKAAVGDALIDLGAGLYAVDNLTLEGSMAYDNNYADPTEGLAPNHISLSAVALRLDSIFYQDPAASLTITNMAMREKSGIELSDLYGHVAMNSCKIRVPDLTIMLPASTIEVEAEMDLSFMDETDPGTLSAKVGMEIGKGDIENLIESLSADADEPLLPRGFMTSYPDQPLTATLQVEGNLERMEFETMEVRLPTAFSLSAEGWAEDLADTGNLRAAMKMNARTGNVGFVMAMLPSDIGDSYSIPYDIRLDADLKANRGRYEAYLNIKEGGGQVDLEGQYDMATNAYAANLCIDSLNVAHYMPKDSIKAVSMSIVLEGKGFDFTSIETSAAAMMQVDKLEYGPYDLNEMSLMASLDEGQALLDLRSDNEMMSGNVNLDALVTDTCLKATLGIDLHQADFQLMRLTEKPFSISICAHMDAESDLDESHKLDVEINDVTLNTSQKSYRPHDLSLSLTTSPDTIDASLESGDFSLHFDAPDGYETILGQLATLLDTIESHREQRRIDGDALKALLPSMRLRVESGPDNIVANYAKTMNIGFQEVAVNLKMSPELGLGGLARIEALEVDSIRIDTIRLGLLNDMRRLGLRLGVANNKQNPQLCFSSQIDAYLEGREIGLNTRYIDAEDSLGVAIGLRAEMRDSGINVRVEPYKGDEVMLGYVPFHLNEDNYIFMARSRQPEPDMPSEEPAGPGRIWADVELRADSGQGVQLFSSDNDSTSLQDLTLSLHRFDLDKITSVIPFAPRITGMLDGDYHFVLDNQSRISVASDMSVDEATYEANAMGDLATEFVYLQREDSTHAVVGTFSRFDEEICAIEGSYRDADEGYLDATLTMASFPLNIANGFIPDQIVGFDGYANGTMSVVGPLSKPVVNGGLQLDSAYIMSVPYGVTLRFDEGIVPVEDSRLKFDGYSLYSPNDEPFTIRGCVDFSDLDRMSLDMFMRTDNYKIIDSRKTSTSVAYGKGYISFAGRMQGTMDDLKLRGNLNVLGKTDMTYILRNSPLSTENRLEGLVTFTDFSDTTQVATVSRPTPGGFDMELTMEIESGARIVCALNVDQSNYVNLEGGGELRMVYNDMDDLQLFGRYTLTEGEMKYALPVIPLKTFQIEEGSYVEFTGDVMNPTLSLTATEDVKALVSSDGSDQRSVQFKCGVKVSQTLSNMGLQFTLEAVDDMTVRNELASMSDEERSKLAVTMLTTGMYLSSDNASGFSMNNALNTFLQSEINNITNNAVKTFDLSLGIDQGADGSGNQYTDYSFKFSKRLWNNRINFVIGGKVSDSSSSSSSDEGGTMIDNVSLEYRLDNTAMRYVRLFYTKDSHDIFEDDLSEYGAGFVWRKKMDKLSDLFKSSKKK